MNIEEIKEIVGDHMDRWEERRHRFAEMYATYADDFWLEHDIPRNSKDQPYLTTQNSVLRKHIEALMAGMFHHGLATHPSLSRIPGPDDPKKAKERQTIEFLMERLLDGVLKESATDLITDNGFSMGLLYGMAGLRLKMDGNGGAHPVDVMDIEPVPGWEIVLDHEERRPNKYSWMGHLRWIDKAEIKALGWSVPVTEYRTWCDWLVEGWETEDTGDSRSRRKMLVLEWWDLVEGTYKAFLVQQAGELVNLKTIGGVKGQPLTSSSGQYLAPLQPVILSPVPHRPNEGLSPVQSVYHLNKERNFVLTMAVNALRFEVQRVMAFRKGLLDETNKERLLSGDDMVMVEFDRSNDKAHLPISQEISFLVPPSVQTVLQALLRHLQSEGADSQSMANAQMGKGQPYATKFEVMNLTKFSESVLGLMSRRMARAVDRFAVLMIYAIRDSKQIEKPILVHHEKSAWELTEKYFSFRWVATSGHGVETAMGKSQRKAELAEALALYSQYVAQAVEPEEAPIAMPTQVEGVPMPAAPAAPPSAPPEVRAAAQKIVNIIVETFDLPEELRWDRVSDSNKDSDATLGMDGMFAQPSQQSEMLEDVIAEEQAAMEMDVQRFELDARYEDNMPKQVI